MGDNNIRIFLIGAGGYGESYLKELTQQATGGELVGICDVAPDLVERYPVISEQGIPVFDTVEAFYQKHEADLAIVSSPFFLHYAQVKRCLEAGSHVLCEKPLCTSLEEAEALKALSVQTGKFVALGYQQNYRPDMLRLKADILAGHFGKPLKMRCVHAMKRGAAYYARNRWAGRITVDGVDVFDSPFHNACAHQFQLMTWLVGDEIAAAAPVELLNAELYRANPNVENYDTAAMRLQTSAGTEILYYTTHAVETKALGPNAEYIFENGTIAFTKDRPACIAHMKNGETIDYSQYGAGKPMQKLHDVLAAVRGEGPLVCDIDADIPHMQAVLALQKEPIRPMKPGSARLYEQDGDIFCAVNGIEDAFTRASSAWMLPSEIGVVW